MDDLASVRHSRKSGLFPMEDGLRFTRTEWWWVQSAANRSRCCLADIRVNFEKNSEPAALILKKALQRRHF